MPAEEPAAVVRRAFDALATGDLAGWFACLAPTYRLHDLPPDQPRDRETLRGLVALIRTAFPDLTIAVDDLLAVGATVTTRETWRGTHLGPLPGIVPTGQAMVLTRMHFFRVERGQIVAEWSAGSIFDRLIAAAAQ